MIYVLHPVAKTDRLVLNRYIMGKIHLLLFYRYLDLLKGFPLFSPGLIRKKSFYILDPSLTKVIGEKNKKLIHRTIFSYFFFSSVDKLVAQNLIYVIIKYCLSIIKAKSKIKKLFDCILKLVWLEEKSTKMLYIDDI